MIWKADMFDYLNYNKIAILKIQLLEKWAHLSSVRFHSFI